MSNLRPNITIPMDYIIPDTEFGRPFAFGKTPLSVRVARYVDWYTFEYGAKPRYIPLHPKEYNKLADSAAWTGIALCWGTYYEMLPLGVRVKLRMEQPA